MKNLRKSSFLAVPCLVAVLVIVGGRFLGESALPEPEAPGTAVRRESPPRSGKTRSMSRRMIPKFGCTRAYTLFHWRHTIC